MAKYEQLGYCPNNKFMTYRSESPVIKMVKTILGRRPNYLVYDKRDVFWSDDKRDSIVDALYGGDGILGIRVATYLELILPEPLEDQDGEGRMIILHDVINPKQIDEDILCFDGGREWEFPVNGGVDRRLKPSSKGTKEGTLKLFFDTRYLVCVQDFGAPRPVHIYLLALGIAEANEVQAHGAPLNGEAMADDELPSSIQVGS